MSLGLALSFDVDRYQCALEMHHFKMLPLGKKKCIYTSSLVLCLLGLYHKKGGKLAQWVGAYCVFCFFFFFFIVDNDSKRILINRFPARHLGNSN